MIKSYDIDKVYKKKILNFNHITKLKQLSHMYPKF